MLVKEIDEMTEKLATAIETTGLTGGLSFKNIAVCKSTEEETGYAAYYSLAIRLPNSAKHHMATFGEKVNP